MSTLADAYQKVRDELATLDIEGDERSRRTMWVVPRVLGVARSAKGIDLFLVGPKLHSRSTLVQRHLDYSIWDVAGHGTSVEANRLVFPGKEQYAPVAAMIAVELANAGLESGASIQSAFSNVEAVIELTLRRAALTEEHLLGLLGELTCLETMMVAVSSQPELLVSVLEMWTGWRGSTRDFRLGTASVEVKTTLASSSTHRFSGLHQVEIAPDEGSLLLLSIGFSSSNEQGTSLANIVSRISERLRRSGIEGVESRFYKAVKSYGAEHGIGYDHAAMAEHHIYTATFSMTFTPRLYDLGDVSMRVLKRVDVERTFVRAEDITFSLDLPETVAPTNPALNWALTITQLTRKALNFVI
jgi:hypothetical protein